MKYLSSGMGVNSVALMLLLLDQGEIFETVFADHGTDYPDTYEYLEMLLGKGYPITCIIPDVEGYGGNLYEYCLKHKIIPVRFMRWCTHKFKVRPIFDYYEKPCTQMLGIDAGESHRARPFSGNDQIENEYPLIERGIDRAGCEAIIKEHGLPIPKKSGCFICPFQGKSQWNDLRDNYPDLWCKAKKLEEVTNERLVAHGREPIYLADMPLDKRVNEAQGNLFGFRKPCICDF